MFGLENKENKEPLRNNASKDIKARNITEPKTNSDNSIVQNNISEASLKENKKKIANFENQIHKIQYEIETSLKENARKNQCIRTCVQENEADKRVINDHIKIIKELEQRILRCSKEMYALQQTSEINAEAYSQMRKDYTGVVQKYEQAKGTIGSHRKNEEQMLKKLECVQSQMAQLNLKYTSLRDQCSDEIKKTQKKEGQGNDIYKREITQLQSMVKRLEIKTISQETALKQKTEECLALSAFYDDIACKQSS